MKNVFDDLGRTPQKCKTAMENGRIEVGHQDWHSRCGLPEPNANLRATVGMPSQRKGGQNAILLCRPTQTIVYFFWSGENVFVYSTELDLPG